MIARRRSARLPHSDAEEHPSQPRPGGRKGTRAHGPAQTRKEVYAQYGNERIRTWAGLPAESSISLVSEDEVEGNVAHDEELARKSEESKHEDHVIADSEEEKDDGDEQVHNGYPDIEDTPKVVVEDNHSAGSSGKRNYHQRKERINQYETHDDRKTESEEVLRNSAQTNEQSPRKYSSHGDSAHSESSNSNDVDDVISSQRTRKPRKSQPSNSPLSMSHPSNPHHSKSQTSKSQSIQPQLDEPEPQPELTATHKALKSFRFPNLKNWHERKRNESEAQASGNNGKEGEDEASSPTEATEYSFTAKKVRKHDLNAAKKAMELQKRKFMQDGTRKRNEKNHHTIREIRDKRQEQQPMKPSRKPQITPHDLTFVSDTHIDSDSLPLKYNSKAAKALRPIQANETHQPSNPVITAPSFMEISATTTTTNATKPRIRKSSITPHPIANKKHKSGAFYAHTHAFQANSRVIHPTHDSHAPIGSETALQEITNRQRIKQSFEMGQIGPKNRVLLEAWGEARVSAESRGSGDGGSTDGDKRGELCSVMMDDEWI